MKSCHAKLHQSAGPWTVQWQDSLKVFKNPVNHNPVLRDDFIWFLVRIQDFIMESFSSVLHTTSGTPFDLGPHILNSLSAEAMLYLYFWPNDEKQAKNQFLYFDALDSHSCTTSSTGLDLQTHLSNSLHADAT